MLIQDKSDWDRVRAMTDEEALANAEADPDSPPTDAMFWADVDMQEPDIRSRRCHGEPDIRPAHNSFPVSVWGRAKGLRLRMSQPLVSAAIENQCITTCFY